MVRGPVYFDEAIFTDDVNFEGVGFEGPAYFDGARFQGEADFADVEFGGHADFDNVTFAGAVSFRRASFSDHAGFEAATFDESADLGGAIFRSYVDLENAVFRRDLRMRGATFQLAHQLGPFRVGQHLNLDSCVFGGRLTIKVTAATISAKAATFADGVRLAVLEAELALDDADFARASTLSRAAYARRQLSVGDDSPRARDQPRLLTLRGAQVSGLSLSEVDLTACRFFGAHDLHALTIEPSCRWPRTPARRLYSARETIAEEHAWRSGRWDSPQTRPSEWLAGRDGTDDLRPEQLATLYRALRKAREDNKDQAGAGDLYYGEMEMRRRTKRGHRRHGRMKRASDKTILTAYWLLSGYGLKAGRALVALLCLAIASAFALREWGFTAEPPFMRAFLYSVESIASVLRAPQVDGYHLTYTGEVIQIVLRLSGPLLIGLALLAVRARVKR